MALCCTRSTTPLHSASRPIGSCRKAALCINLSRSWDSTREGLEPVLSSLLMNAIQGTLYRFICLIAAGVVVGCSGGSGLCGGGVGG